MNEYRIIFEETTVKKLTGIETRATWLIEHYTDLVRQAKDLAFPRMSTSKLAPQDTSNWPKVWRWVYKVAAPFSWMAVDKPDVVSLFVTLAWTMALSMWLICALMDLQFAAGIPFQIQGLNSIPAPPSELFTRSWGWLLDALTIACYLNWGRFLFFDKRFFLKQKLVAVGAFLGLILVIFWSLLTIPPFQGIKPILSTPDRAETFILLCLRFVVPLSTFFFSGVVHAFISIVMVVDNVGTAYAAFPKEKMIKLVTSLIPNPRDGAVNWCLMGLAKADIGALKGWAIENREGTDKRLLPTAIILAFIAIFANTTWFNEGIERIINPIVILFKSGDNVVQRPNFWTYFVLGLIFSVVVRVLKMWVSLFNNLVVQSLIVEACLVAEYASEPEEKMEDASESLAKPTQRSLWGCIRQWWVDWWK